MATPPGPNLPLSPHHLEVVARTLRHEVGDLLQTVYSTVAIVAGRLGEGQALERRLLTDLKARAETCRQELDAIVDLVCPINLVPGPVEVTQLFRALLPGLMQRFPALSISLEPAAPVWALADARRLAQLFPMLATSACHSAQRQVRVQVVTLPGQQDGAGEVECSICDDGLGANEEQLSWFHQPFATTHHAAFGLGLALARRLAGAHGGRASAANLPGGGFCVRVVLPACGPPSEL